MAMKKYVGAASYARLPDAPEVAESDQENHGDGDG